MRSTNRVVFFDGLEDRCVMSHVVVSHLQVILHPALVHKLHAPAVHQITSFGAHHGSIVHHSSFKAAAVKAAQGTGSLGGGNIDLTIPFITGTPQFPLNFTSNTYQNVLFGTGGWDGIQQIADRFGHINDINQLTTDLTALSFRMPFGNQQLLQVWLTDLQSLQSGSLTPIGNGIVWSDTSTGQAVGDVLFADLQTYLGDGLGTSFNILKSVINWNSDNLLTYNGSVGSNSLT